MNPERPPISCLVCEKIHYYPWAPLDLWAVWRDPATPEGGHGYACREGCHEIYMTQQALEKCGSG